MHDHVESSSVKMENLEIPLFMHIIGSLINSLKSVACLFFRWLLI